MSIEIVKTKSEEHGDWSSNVAMIEAKKRGENPKELAKKIINSISKLMMLEKDLINLKGKTVEKLGLIGKEKAIACRTWKRSCFWFVIE